MVVPLGVRVVAAVAGALLVVTAWASVIGTLIVPRPVSSWLTRWADRTVNEAFRLVTGRIALMRNDSRRTRPSARAPWRPHPRDRGGRSRWVNPVRSLAALGSCRDSADSCR